jgi:hypothetical protein
MLLILAFVFCRNAPAGAGLAGGVDLISDR